MEVLNRGEESPLNEDTVRGDIGGYHPHPVVDGHITSATPLHCSNHENMCDLEYKTGNPGDGDPSHLRNGNHELKPNKHNIGKFDSNLLQSGLLTNQIRDNNTPATEPDIIRNQYGILFLNSRSTRSYHSSRMRYATFGMPEIEDPI